MAKFYSNENFPRRTIEVLRELGHDVLTSLEAGNANQRIPDESVLEFAKQQKRMILTINRQDFDHFGIIVCTQNPDFPAQAHLVHEALIAIENPTERLIRVNRGGFVVDEI